MTDRLRCLALLAAASALAAATVRETEAAVESGLRFLTRQQTADGSWDPLATQARCHDDPPPRAGGRDDRIALTAQATLAFLATGHDHKTPSRHRARSQRGLAWLLAAQAADGRWSSDPVVQAEAAQAVAEAYGMTNDPGLREAATRGLAAMAATRIEPGSLADAALAEALAAGRAAGLPATAPALPALHAAEPEAGALLAALAGDPRLAEQGAAVVTLRLIQRQAFDLRRARYASTALIRLGGPLWERWNPAVRDAVVAGQRSEGEREGSWDLPGDSHPYAGRGRLQATTDALLTLSVYYRYSVRR